MFDLAYGAVTRNVQTWDQRSEKVLSEIFWLEKAYLFLILDTVLYFIIAAWVTNVFPGIIINHIPFFFLFFMC